MNEIDKIIAERTSQLNTPSVTSTPQEATDLDSVLRERSKALNEAPDTTIREYSMDDTSKYDRNIVPGLDQNANRANRQGAWAKWGNGLGKALTTIPTTIGQAAGVIGGGLPAIIEGDADLAFKNPVVNFFEQWQEATNKALPNYYDEQEQNQGVLANLATHNFWSDKFLNGLGFVASSFIPGGAIAKGATGLKAALLASRAGKLSIAASILGEVNTAAKVAKITNSMGVVGGALVGRIGESAIEANQVYDETLSTTGNEDKARLARMNTFGANMLLALPDMYQFSKIFGSYRNARQVVKGVKSSATKGLEEVAQGKVSRLFDYLGEGVKQAGIESQEENFQLAVQNTMKTMASGKFSSLSWESTAEMFAGITEGMAENFGTKEGQEAMLLGGLIGGGLGGAINYRQSKAEAKKVQRMIKEYAGVNQSTVDNIVAFTEMEALKNSATEDGNRLTFDFAKQMQFNNWVKAKIEIGEVGSLVLELEAYRTMDPKEFTEKLGVQVKDVNAAGIEKNPASIADKAIMEVRRLEKIHESIEEAFPGLDGRTKSYLFHNLSVQEFLDKKITKLLPAQIEEEARKSTSTLTGIPFVASLAKISEITDLKAAVAAKKQLVAEYQSLLDPTYQQQITRELNEDAETPDGEEVELKTHSALDKLDLEAAANSYGVSGASKESFLKELNEALKNIEAGKDKIKSDEDIKKYIANSKAFKLLGIDDSIKAIREHLGLDFGPTVGDTVGITNKKGDVEVVGKIEKITKDDEGKSYAKIVGKEQLIPLEDVITVPEGEDLPPTPPDGPDVDEDLNAQNEPSEADAMSFTMFRTTGDNKEAILEADLGRLRAHNFLSKFKGNPADYKLKVVTNQTREFYKSLLNEKQLPHIDKEAALFVLVDKANKIIYADEFGDVVSEEVATKHYQEGEPSNKQAYGPIVLPMVVREEKEKFFAVSPKNFSKRGGIPYKKGDEKDPKSTYSKAWVAHLAKHKALREKIVKGQVEYLPITGRSQGIPQTTPEIRSIVGTIVTDLKKIGPVTFRIPQAQSDSLKTGLGMLDESAGLPHPVAVKLGRLYAIKDGALIQLKPRALSPQEVSLVIDLLSLYNELDPTSKEGKTWFYAQEYIGKLIYMSEKDQSPKRFYIKDGIVHFGSNSVAVADAKNSDELKAFLATKVRQANNKDLKSNVQVTVYNSLADFKSKAKTKTSCNEFLFGGENPAFATNLVPFQEKTHDVQFMNSYFTYNPEGYEARTPIPAPVVPAKIDAISEDLGEGRIKLADLQEDEEFYFLTSPTSPVKRYFRKTKGEIKFYENVGGDPKKAVDAYNDSKKMEEIFNDPMFDDKGKLFFASDRGEPKALEKTEEPRVEEKKEEIPKPGKLKRVRKDFGAASSDSGLDLTRRILRAPGAKIEDMERFSTWFAQKFPGEPLMISKAIEQDVQGRFKDGLVTLYEGAEEGTGYHEAFHKVTQQYLSQAERTDLYTEYRKRTGNKAATELEAEEALAEDFRKYMLGDRRTILGSQRAQNIFKRLWKFLQKLFTGKTTIQDVYERIASKPAFGTASKPYNSTDFKRAIPTKTEKETKAILDGVNYFFFRILFGNKLTPTQILQSADGIKTIEKIYDKVKENINAELNQVLDDHDALVDGNERTTYPEATEEQLLNLIEQYEFILEHWDEQVAEGTRVMTIKEAHKDYLKRFGLKVTIDKIEEVDVDDLDGNDMEIEDSEEAFEVTREAGQFKNSNETSTIESMSTNIKLLIQSLPKKNNKGEQEINEIGLPVLVNFTQTYNYLLKNLAGLSTPEAMWAKLREISLKDPSINELLVRLGDLSETQNDNQAQLSLKAEFIRDFRKMEYRGTITLIDPETGNIYQTDANANRLRDRIRERWVANLRRNAKENKDGLLTLDPKVLDIKDTQKAEFLRAIGINFTGLTDLEVKDRVDLEKVQFLRSSIRKMIKDGTPITTLFAKEADELGNLGALLEIEAETTTESIELTYMSAENKSIYAVTLHNYYSTITSAINNSLTKQELLDKHPHLNTSFAQPSYWLSEIFDVDGNRKLDKNGKPVRLIMSTSSGLKVQGDNDSGRSTTSLETGDKLVQEFNVLLTTGATSLTRAGDKSTEYEFGLSNGFLPVPIAEFAEGFDSDRLKGIFMDYFYSELERIKERRSGVGANLAVYGTDQLDKNKKTIPNSSKAANWQVFDDILKPKTKERIEETLEKNLELSDGLLNQVEADVVEYFNNYYNNRVHPMFKYYRVGENLGDKYLGISKTLTHDANGKPLYKVDQLFRAFAANHLINTIEQHKLLIGDPAFYKDKFKRISGGTGTKKLPWTGNAINSWLNTHQERVDGKIANDEINVVIFNDHKAKSKYLDSYAKALASSFNGDINKALEVLDAYGKMDEGDAQGWITLDEYREFFIRAGEWQPLHEAQYQFETGKTSVNPKFVFMPIKAQYFGPQIYDKVNAIAFHKYSLMPLTPRLVAGTNMQSLLDSMTKNQIGYALFGSGSKVGSLLQDDGTLPGFYNKDGSISDMSNVPVQRISYDFLGIQLDIAPKLKEKVVFGTQFRKLIMSNLFEGGVAKNPTFQILLDEYNKVENTLINREFDNLVEDLGAEINTDGGYTIKNIDKLISLLQESADDRSASDNLIDSIELAAKEGTLDNLVNRPKIENLLMSIVNSRVIRQKMNGDGMIQGASSGFETIGKRDIGTSNELAFYTQDAFGTTTAMEVMVPLNGQYADLLKKYDTLEGVNAALERGEIDEKILTLIGYRIPTQGLNSIDFLKIKKFLPDSSGNLIILPTEIVAKSGGDYDIDKLNVFRPNIKYNSRTRTVSYVDAIDETGIRELWNRYQKSMRELEEVTDPNALASQFKYEVARVVSLSKQELDEILKHNVFTVSEEEFVANFKQPTKMLQNRIIELSKEVLEHPYNFNSLITPNSTSILTDLVELIRELKGQPKKAPARSATRELEFPHILDQFKYFLSGKGGVGVGAVHNTHHILAQIGNVTLNTDDKGNLVYYKRAGGKLKKKTTKIYFDNNRTEGKIDLSKQTDTAGNSISEILSQFINAYVDIAKDPFVFDLNAGTSVAGIYFYLIRQGIDIKTVALFMTQPIIEEYVRAEAVNKSVTVAANGQQLKAKLTKQERGSIARTITEIDEQIAASKDPEQILLLRQNKAAAVARLDNLYDRVREKYIDKLGSAPTAKEFAHYGKETANDKLMSFIKQGGASNDPAFLKAQLQFLDNFLEYKEQASILTDFMGTVNFDTNTVKNFGSIKAKRSLIGKVAETNMVSAAARARVLQNTIVGSFDKIEQIDSLYRRLFITESNPDTKEVLEDMLAKINPPKKKYIKVYETLTNDFIGYITQKFGVIDGQNMAEYGKSLFQGKESLAKRLIDLKQDEDLSNNALIIELQSLIDANTAGIDNVRVYSRRLLAHESNILTEAFNELLESKDPKVAKFAKDLVVLGILQSGLHNSPLTYLSLIPYKIYGEIVGDALKAAKDNIDYEDFKNRFYVKNVHDKSIVPMDNLKNRNANATREFVQRFNGKDQPNTVKKRIGTSFVEIEKLAGFESITPKWLGHKLQDFNLTGLVVKKLEVGPALDPAPEQLQSESLDTEVTREIAKSIMVKLSQRFGVKYNIIEDASQRWAGRFSAGVATINLAYARLDTPFHEYAHPFIHAVKLQNPVLYDNLVKEIKAEKKILARTVGKYTDLSSEEQYEEAIVQAIGEYAAGVLREGGLMAAIKTLLKRVSTYLNSLMNGKKSIVPGELDPETTLQEMGAIMNLTNPVELPKDSIGGLFEQNETEKLQNNIVSLGRVTRDTIDPIVDYLVNLEVVEKLC